MITKHYHGDDSDVQVLMGGTLLAFGGMNVEAYERAAGEFRADATRRSAVPTAIAAPADDRLRRHLEANRFKSFIA